jgi:hypothetical protein
VQLLPTQPTIVFEPGRPNLSKKLLGKGITGDQNVAGMWLKYG